MWKQKADIEPPFRGYYGYYSPLRKTGVHSLISKPLYHSCINYGDKSKMYI